MKVHVHTPPDHVFFSFSFWLYRIVGNTATLHRIGTHQSRYYMYTSLFLLLLPFCLLSYHVHRLRYIEYVCLQVVDKVLFFFFFFSFSGHAVVSWIIPVSTYRPFCREQMRSVVPWARNSLATGERELCVVVVVVVVVVVGGKGREGKRREGSKSKPDELQSCPPPQPPPNQSINQSPESKRGCVCIQVPGR